MAGATGLEPATSGVTGQRSNQLSYAPRKLRGRQATACHPRRQWVIPKKVIRATDAKEVGVENPSEETFCRPNQRLSVWGEIAKGGPNCQTPISTNLPLRKISRDIRARIRIFPPPRIGLGRPLRLVVRTPAFHAGNTGSTPVGVAIFAFFAENGLFPVCTTSD